MTTRDLATLRARAAAGHPAALYELGCRCQRGEDAPPDLATAVRCFTAAAAQGHDRAQTELGRRYAQGAGVARNVEVAEFWLRAAVAQGEPGAAYELARLLDAGEIRAESPGEAAHWWRLAAAAGVAEARLHFGFASLESVADPAGHGVTEEWISSAAPDEFPAVRTPLARWSSLPLGRSRASIAAAS